MGIQDRDWYRDAQREREKQAALDATKKKFTRYTNTFMGIKAANNASSCGKPEMGLIPMLVFWFVVMGLLYALMHHYLKPKPPRVSANGELVIKRASDGHFYAPGTVNGYPVTFMVDTGATLVSVSETVAKKLSLNGGVQTTFRTANGDQPGRIVGGVGVAVGPMSVTGVRVGIGLRMADANEALLGQSFLSKFKITMDGSTMVLKPH
jgi:aspartyl protease family protein